MPKPMLANLSPVRTRSTASSSATRPGRAFTWAYLAVLSLFLLPPNLLYQFGIDYDTSGGNPATKIRPATYLAVIGAMSALWAMYRSRSGRPFSELRVAITFMVVVAVCAVFSFISVGAASSSNYVDTFLAAGFLTMALDGADVRQRRLLGYTLMALVVVSVFMAFVESAKEMHIIPMQIGNLDMRKIQGRAPEDFRAAGLYSHPLVASMVTSMSIFLLLSMRLRLWLAGTLLALLSVGLLSYGGRAALGVTVATLVIAGLLFLLFKLVSRGLSAEIIAATLAAGILLPMLFAVLLAETEVGARIVATMSFDDNSAEVRSVQWEVLRFLDLRDVLFGVSREQIDVLKGLIGLSGQGNDIESPWLLLFLNLGVVGFLPLVVGLFCFLIDIARRGGWPAGWMMIASYLVIASTSNSFGVKTPDFCFLVAFAFAMSGFKADATIKVSAVAPIRPDHVKMAWGTGPARRYGLALLATNHSRNLRPGTRPTQLT